jgi:hypothetical protein
MKIPQNLQKFSPVELGVLILFVLYILLPIQTPSFMVDIVDGPLGLVFMFLVTVFLFLYTNPILAIVYIFVAYEVLRRTSAIRFIDSTPQAIKPNALNGRVKEIAPLFKNERVVNENQATSLEEEVVAKMAPIGVTPALAPEGGSTFKPVSENVGGASLF